jgi:ABC-type sugar transport system permease subunit
MDKKISLKLPKRRKRSLDARRARAGYLFTLPFILGILLVYLPILLDSIWFSFNQEIPGPIVDGMPTYVIEFVGLDFYKEAFETPDFVTALLAGLQQLVLEVPAVIIFSLFIAVVLNQKMVGRAAFRAIFFVPVIIATGIMETINASDAMQNMMSGGIDDGSGSSASDIVSAMDIEKMFAELGFGSEIVASVVGLVNNIYNIINYSGVQMLIFLAGLQSISPAIYEACTIDGATGWETFWKITFPMISPMILVNAAYTIIDAFTRETNPVMTYIDTVKTNAAIAMSWIYFVIVVLIILVVAAVASSFIFYQRRD